MREVIVKSMKVGVFLCQEREEHLPLNLNYRWSDYLKMVNQNLKLYGSIGGAVAESLKHSKYALTALIHKNTNTFLENNANLIKGSLTDVTLLEDHLQNHDYLFIAVNAGNDPEAIKRIEEDAVINVLKDCRRCWH